MYDFIRNIGFAVDCKKIHTLGKAGLLKSNWLKDMDRKASTFKSELNTYKRVLGVLPIYYL